jgi:hypothetical protein
MYPWFFLGGLHHAIVAALVAFFVLFAAGKADGFVKILGNVLGWLVLIIAVLWLVGAATMPYFGGHPFGLSCLDAPSMMGPHWGPPSPVK